MDGYTLTDKLRKTRRRHNLPAATQALYYELVAICNEEGWADEFRCSNDELCSALRITERSLVDYRLNLIQAGLIVYKSGKSKKEIGCYSFNGCKIYAQSGSQSNSQSYNQSNNQSGSQSGEKRSDYIIGQTETESKLNKTSFSVGKPPVKKVGKAAGLEEIQKTPFWPQLVETWFSFNEKKFGGRPSFKGADPRYLKKIVEILEKRAVAKNETWSETTAPERLRSFLENAFLDEWTSKNFLLQHLEKFIDKFILNQNGGQNKQNSENRGTVIQPGKREFGKL